MIFLVEDFEAEEGAERGLFLLFGVLTRRLLGKRGLGALVFSLQVECVDALKRRVFTVAHVELQVRCHGLVPEIFHS